jgi:hypothetical protein
VRYAQKQAKRAFLVNMTTVLPGSGLVGLSNETFLGSEGPPARRSRGPRQSKWQDRRIIPATPKGMPTGRGKIPSKSGTSEKLWLTRGSGVRYAQRREQTGFLVAT